MQAQGEMTMIVVCNKLQRVLKNIRGVLEAGEYEHLPEHLSERMKLHERLHESMPDRGRLNETIRILKEIAREERFLLRLADEKKAELQREMKTLKARRRAVETYQVQSLYVTGV